MKKSGEENREEKIGRAVVSVNYVIFALRRIAVFTLAALVILFLVHKPLWLAPVIGTAVFFIYRALRRWIISGLIRFGRNSSGKR